MSAHSFPLNPGASHDIKIPNGITWLPQDADITLVGQQTNCYVIRGTAGAWVVDPPSSKAAALEEILNVAGTVAGIWLTHAHPDHTGGVAPLAARTGAPVYAHPRAWVALQGDFQRIEVTEGDSIGAWQVYALPGHRFDHLAFIHADSRVAIVGDLVAGAGSVIVDPADGDLYDYFNSLHRLHDEIAPALLLPGHGALSADPAALISHFIAHRLKRERLVLAALGSDPQPPAALLPRAYADTPPHLYPLAERALLAHLLKLQRDGRALESSNGWRLS